MHNSLVMTPFKFVYFCIGLSISLSNNIILWYNDRCGLRAGGLGRWRSTRWRSQCGLPPSLMDNKVTAFWKMPWIAPLSCAPTTFSMFRRNAARKQYHVIKSAARTPGKWSTRGLSPVAGRDTYHVSQVLDPGKKKKKKGCCKLCTLKRDVNIYHLFLPKQNLCAGNLRPVRYGCSANYCGGTSQHAW